MHSKLGASANHIIGLGQLDPLALTVVGEFVAGSLGDPLADGLAIGRVGVESISGNPVLGIHAIKRSGVIAATDRSARIHVDRYRLATRERAADGGNHTHQPAPGDSIFRNRRPR